MLTLTQVILTAGMLLPLDAIASPLYLGVILLVMLLIYVGPVVLVGCLIITIVRKIKRKKAVADAASDKVETVSNHAQSDDDGEDGPDSDCDDAGGDGGAGGDDGGGDCDCGCDDCDCGGDDGGGDCDCGCDCDCGGDDGGADCDD